MTAERGGYVAGLRLLADLLERHDELPLPSNGQGFLPLSICFFGDDARDQLARYARIFPGTLRKGVRDHSDDGGDAYFDLHGMLAGLSVKATAMRDTICTRVVTGTREVTEEIPDPDALAAVPVVTVTKTVEEVSWDCGPILTGRTS